MLFELEVLDKLLLSSLSLVVILVIDRSTQTQTDVCCIATYLRFIEA